MSILGVRGSSLQLSKLKQSTDVGYWAHNTAEVGYGQLAASYLNDDFSTSLQTRLPVLNVDPPFKWNTAQRLVAWCASGSNPRFWLVKKTVGATDPQMAICEHQIAGSMYNRKSLIWWLVEFMKKVYTMFNYFHEWNNKTLHRGFGIT